MSHKSSCGSGVGGLLRGPWHSCQVEELVFPPLQKLLGKVGTEQGDTKAPHDHTVGVRAFVWNSVLVPSGSPHALD